MERIFQLAAVLFAGVAAYFLWNGNGDGAFVSGVLGAVSYFLSIRFQVKERNRLREAEAAGALSPAGASDIPEQTPEQRVSDPRA